MCRADRSSIRSRASSSFGPGRSSRNWCWWTKSIGRRRGRKRRCLEAMAEGSVTIDGTTHKLAPPFLLIATQNPIDHEGTFPLPEAQLDRFLIKLSLGYPTIEEETQMLDMQRSEHPLEKLQPVLTAEQLAICQRAVRTVHVDPKIRRYITEIVHATRGAPRHRARRQPAGVDRALSDVAGDRGDPRPEFRRAGRCEEHCPRGARASDYPASRGAAAECERRRTAHRHLGSCEGAALGTPRRDTGDARGVDHALVGHHDRVHCGGGRARSRLVGLCDVRPVWRDRLESHARRSLVGGPLGDAVHESRPLEDWR